MAETIYTQALAKAAEIHGSTQALASSLHVPENTLARWISGRAQMPLRAFLKLIEALMQHERAGGHGNGEEKSSDRPLTFRAGNFLARCARCDCTQFVPAEPGAAARLTGRLACQACGEQVVHGDVIMQLAKDAVHGSRAAPRGPERRV